MQSLNGHILTELRYSLHYQQRLFDQQKKQGCTFEQLKAIYLRIKELRNDIQILISNSAR